MILALRSREECPLHRRKIEQASKLNKVNVVGASLLRVRILPASGLSPVSAWPSQSLPTEMTRDSSLSAAATANTECRGSNVAGIERLFHDTGQVEFVSLAGSIVSVHGVHECVSK